MELNDLISTSASAVVVGSAIVGMAIAPYRALLSRLKGFSEQFEKLDGRFGGMSDQLITIDGRLASLEKRIGNIETKVDEAGSLIASHGERLAFLEGSRRWRRPSP